MAAPQRFYIFPAGSTIARAGRGVSVGLVRAALTTRDHARRKRRPTRGPRWDSPSRAWRPCSRTIEDWTTPRRSFEGFGDNALNLILRADVGSIDHRLATITALHKAINDRFERAGISIAFPQRDLHQDAREPLRVRIEDARSQAPEGGGDVREDGSDSVER